MGKIIDKGSQKNVIIKITHHRKHMPLKHCIFTKLMNTRKKFKLLNCNFEKIAYI